MTQEKIVPLFKQAKGNATVVLPNGRKIMFANGRYFTEETEIIETLVRMAKTKEAGVFIDPQEPDVDMFAATPLEQERKRIRRELLAELRANPSLLQDSSYGAGANRLNVSGTTDVVPEQLEVGQRTAAVVVENREQPAATASAALAALKNSVPKAN